MKHLARILAVVVPVLAVVATSALKTPAVIDLLRRHPGAAGYVLIGGGIVHAAWQAYKDTRRENTATPPNQGGSASMGAK